LCGIAEIVVGIPSVCGDGCAHPDAIAKSFGARLAEISGKNIPVAIDPHSRDWKAHANEVIAGDHLPMKGRVLCIYGRPGVVAEHNRSATKSGAANRRV